MTETDLNKFFWYNSTLIYPSSVLYLLIISWNLHACFRQMSMKILFIPRGDFLSFVMPETAHLADSVTALFGISQDTITPLTTRHQC